MFHLTMDHTQPFGMGLRQLPRQRPPGTQKNVTGRRDWLTQTYSGPDLRHLLLIRSGIVVVAGSIARRIPTALLRRPIVTPGSVAIATIRTRSIPIRIPRMVPIAEITIVMSLSVTILRRFRSGLRLITRIGIATSALTGIRTTATRLGITRTASATAAYLSTGAATTAVAAGASVATSAPSATQAAEQSTGAAVTARTAATAPRSPPCLGIATSKTHGCRRNDDKPQLKTLRHGSISLLKKARNDGTGSVHRTTLDDLRYPWPSELVGINASLAGQAFRSK
jgi:hypothetical protein